MYSLAFLIGASFLLSLVLTAWCRNLCRRWGLVDVPGGQRKTHSRAVPRIGGAPILLSCAIAFGVFLVAPLKAGELVQSGLPMAWKIVPAVALIFLTGLWDDLWGLSP